MAGSRLVVHDSVADTLVEKIVSRAKKIEIGDPKAAETEMGPLATSQQFDKVLSHANSAREQGVTIACGVSGSMTWVVSS